MKIKFFKVITIGFLFILGILFATSLSWVGNDVSYQGSEDMLYFHNLSANISDPADDMVFSITSESGNTIFWNGSEVSYSNISTWVFILNSSLGDLFINATQDNQTGLFRIPFKVAYGGGSSGSIVSFNFTLNATNDAPTFVNLRSQEEPYNTSALTSGSSHYNFSFSGLDEELHYPLLIKNLTIFDDCSKASWTDQLNCSLGNYTFSQTGNTNLIINFTNITLENVGEYNLSVCISDTLNESALPTYLTADYQENKTSCQNFSLNVFYSLGINASNCSGISLIEGQNLSCYLDVNTRLPSQSFTMNSTAFLFNSNFITSLIGRNWLYSLKTNTSSGYFLRVPINITNLSKRNAGNWTINFYINDSDANSVSENITFFVNRTNAIPSFSFNFLTNDAVSSTNLTSINVNTLFRLNITDEDFLVPDKNLWNETVNLSIRVLNQSNTSQEVFWYNFSNKTFYYTSGNTSLVMDSILFSPNASQVGNWRVNFSYIDKEGIENSTTFDFSVVDNQPPYWIGNSFDLNCTVPAIFNVSNVFCTYSLQNGTIVTENGFNINLTNSSNGVFWANDSDTSLSGLEFVTLGEAPQNFLITNEMLSFFPWKQDVSQYISGGIWVFNLSVDDSFSTDTSLILRVNISNTNSLPKIQNITPALSISFNESESALVSFRVYDSDFLIPGDLAVDWNFTSSVAITAFNALENLSISVSRSTIPVLDGDKYYLHNITFIPKKENGGNFTFNLSVIDYPGALNWTFFNVSILTINNAPNLTNVKNLTSAVGRILEYRFNVNDVEDGNSSTEGNTNFNFSVINLSGTNLFSETTFNFTTGVFNISLNQSHAGKHQFSFTVNDSEGLNNTKTFWIYVYDVPNVTLPVSGYVFNGTENTTITFNITANHSVADNLTYEIWIDSVHSCSFGNSSSCIYSLSGLRDNVSGYGNSTNFSFSFIPNFTDESYGLLKNLTIIVYPYNINLDNANLLNSSIDVKLNISHTNYPLEFFLNIDNPNSVENDQAITLDLSDYFIDYDAVDTFHLQKINFSLQGNSLVQGSFSDWILTLSLLTNVNEATEILNITAYEINSTDNSTIRNLTSNNFEVEFTEPAVVQTPSSGGGGSTVTKHASLLIGVPSAIQVGFEDQIEVPISIKNNGEVQVTGIALGSFVQLDGLIVDGVAMSLSKSSIASLAVGATEELIANINVDTRGAGRYLGIIYANVTSPKFNQEGQFYIEIEVLPSQNVEEILIFTEKLIVDNPECLELRARLEDVRLLKEEGKFDEAIKLSEEIVDSCRKSISQKKIFSLIQGDVSKVLIYLFVGLIGVFIFVFAFYVYKRVKFNKGNIDEYV